MIITLPPGKYEVKDFNEILEDFLPSSLISEITTNDLIFRTKLTIENTKMKKHRLMKNHYSIQD